jgi:Ca2+-binding RTX toxin-like protein
VEGAALAPDGGTFIAFEEEMSNRATVGNLVKLLPNGSLDPGFGAGGRVQIANRVGTTSPSGLAVDGEGRLVGLGWDGSISLFRLRANGSTDRTFNGGEHVTVAIGGDQEAPVGIGLQSGGRIVALAETSCCGPKAFALIGLRGGISHLRCLGRRATIVGTRGRDQLTGTRGRDVIAVLGGRDEVRALAGNDVICGGPGRDRIFGGPGRDRVRR